MKEWLEEIIIKLHRVKTLQHQFFSAICVACCLQLCHVNSRLKKKEFLFPLLRMLQVQSDAESRTCPEYACLCDLLVEQRFWYELCMCICCIHMHNLVYVCVSLFSAHIAASIEQLCVQAAKADTRDPNTDWLFVLPLYHFTKGTSKPFMPSEHNPEKIMFKTGLLAHLGDNWRLPQG